MNIEKTLMYNQLFDHYESLLTPRQQEIFRYYYHDDLSYQEIADLLGISRAAAFDNLNRTSKLLEDYEEKLGLQTLIQALESLENNDVTHILNTYKKGENHE